jgi:geranylgeranylglycerol-phosphate geranylgeranyltransferase
VTILLSTAMAFFIDMFVFVIVLLFNTAAVLYSWKLKDLPLVGNIYIALTMSIPFIFGNYVVSRELSPVIIVLALLGFVAGLAREIVKSVQDMEGDIKARGSRTLPVMIGKRPAIMVAILLYIIFIGLTAVPFTLMAIPFAAMGMIFLADVMIAAVCYKALQGDFEYARKKSLMAFFFGMFALLMASL